MPLPDFDTLAPVEAKSALPDFDTLKPYAAPAKKTYDEAAVKKAEDKLPDFNPKAGTPESNLAPDFDRNIQLQKQAIATREMGGDIEPTTDLLTAIAKTPALDINPNDPLSPVKAPVRALTAIVENVAAAGLNIPASMYRYATGKTPMQSVTKFDENGKPYLTMEPKPLPFQPGKPVYQPRGTVLQPEGNWIEQMASGFTTPGGIATFPFLEAKPVQAYFLAQTAPGAIDAAEQLVSKDTPPDLRRRAATDFLINSLMSYGLAKGIARPRSFIRPETPEPDEIQQPQPAPPVQPEGAQPQPENASNIPEPTEIHGNVRPQPLEGQGQMPPEKSGGRIQPQTTGRLPTPQPKETGAREVSLTTPSGETVTPRTPAPEHDRFSELQTVGKDMGFSFDGPVQFPGIKPLLSFTFKDVPKNDPVYGATFSTPPDATGAEILTKANDVAAKFREGKTTATAPAPTVTEPIGTWRKSFDNEPDIFRKNDILRAVADVSQSDKELSDILDRVGALSEKENFSDANTLHAIAVNRFASEATKKRVAELMRQSEEKTRATLEKETATAPTQEQQVTEALRAGGPKTADQLAKELDIINHNIRRILGQGAKAGKFERIARGVYAMKNENGSHIYVESTDAVTALPELAKRGVKVDFVFLDPPYKTVAITGGNRGVKNYGLISPQQFATVVTAAKQMLRNPDTPIYYMFSQAPSGLAEMQRYTDAFEQNGLKLAAVGEWQKTFKDGTPVTNPRGELAAPEGVALFTQSGKVSSKLPEGALKFKTVRPPVAGKGGRQSQKPAEIYNRLLGFHTKELPPEQRPNFISLDPFAGTGGLAEASKREGVSNISLEIDPNAVEKFIVPKVEGVETPSAATEKVAEHIAEVKREEGQRPAKEVKSELVDRLEKAVAAAKPLPEKAKAELDKLDTEAKNAPNFEVRKRKYEQMGDIYRRAKIEKITIDIPGDGTFTVWNTKEALTEVLTRAKRLSTTATESPKIRYTGTSKADREWVEKNKQTVEPGESPQSVFESRIESAHRSHDVFEMDEGDLADLLEERYGERPAGATEGAFGRSTGDFYFPSYDEFAKWMDERYAERDHEGMRLAFAEAPTPNKIRYIKENRGANEREKAWLTNLATGAPLPANDGPVARTTPRPLPGGRKQPVPQPGTSPSGGRPQGPPPAPRNPTHHRPFDITALTQLFRQFGKYPVMNARLRRAYGRFMTDSQVVELKKRLLWDPALATRVLGHEIGHFFDLAVAMLTRGKGKQFANYLRPLTDFKNMIGAKQELRNEARNLSRDWRGDFQNGDSYRDTGEELMADVLSAMLTKPEWVNQKYPKIFDAFQEFRDAKPAFKYAYREVETWLQGDTMARELADQDQKAIHRTLDILTEKKTKARASFTSQVMFKMVTLWQRAFEKEGKPRLIGTSTTEKLEGSYLWAAKKLALWHDEFLNRVQPELNKVSQDPIDARAKLLSYSKAVRTIGERRAAGIWIEQHPDESRKMLAKILRMDPTLHYKLADELERTPDAGLYDFAAKTFREIHDRGEKFVNRVSREIDAMKFGLDGDAALMAFNVRGKLLNPGGLTVENAQKMLDYLRNELGPDKFQALENSGAGLRDLIYQTQSEMHDAGLIADKIWKELIEPNKDNYLPYAVLDYFDGKVSAGVRNQIGTARDVADVVAATELKAASSYVWLQRQRQVQLLREAYARGGLPLAVGEELDRAGDLRKIQAEHAGDDISRSVIWVDGKPHLMEFPGDPGKLLQDAMNLPEFYSHMEWFHAASKFSHQVMQLFTQLSPRFLLYRNIIRGFRTAGLKVGFGRAFQQMSPENLRHNLTLARNYAEAAFGKTMLPEVRALVESEALPPPHLALGAVRDLPNMRELLTQGALPVFSARHLRPDIAEKRGPVSEKARQAKSITDRMFTGYEAFEKIYNYQAAMKKWGDPVLAAAIAKRGGIPRPGVVGKWSSFFEVFYPWTRVRLQGMRASYDMMRDPRTRKGFLARFMLTEGAPRIAKVAIAVALASKIIRMMNGNKPDDKDDPVMAEVFRRISPYKMALDDVVPYALYDPRTGKYHTFWEYQKGADIPKWFEVVSVRIPSSEEGQTFGTGLYAALTSLPGANEQLAQPGKGVVENMSGWAYNYLFPSQNPFFQTADQLSQMVFFNRNPQDTFRGQPAANPDLFNAGGANKAQAVAGYTLNQLGGPGEVGAAIAGNVGMIDPRAFDSIKSRLATDVRPMAEKLPFLGTGLSYDNYAEYRTEKEAQLAEDQLRAKARLIMSPDVRSLYDFYYLNKDRQDKLTPQEKIQFDYSKHFVQKIWGTLNANGKPNPNSFYSKAAHAVSPDGSPQSKETVKRDLDNAARVDVYMFKQVNH